MLERAIDIAVDAHAGQTDRYGRPYILHPLRLMRQASTVAERIVAILHDVVEDNPAWTLNRLRNEGFADEIVEAVDNLTRRGDDEPYAEYVLRAASSPLSRRIKLFDLRDNMDLTSIPALDERAIERLRRYHAAWRALADLDA